MLRAQRWKVLCYNLSVHNSLPLRKDNMKVAVPATWHMKVGTERRKLKPITKIHRN